MQLTLAALLASALLAPTAFGQQELYVHGGDGVIYRVDNYATQPTPVALGTAAPLNGDLPVDIAVDPASGDFYLTVFPGGSASGSYTYLVDKTTFVANRVGGFNLFSMNGLETSADGNLFATGAVVFSFVKIDTTTGGHFFITNNFDAQTAGDVASTQDGRFLMTTALGDIEEYDPIAGTTTNLGPHGFGSAAFGIEIDTDGTIYIALQSGDLYTYDLTTMTSTFVGSIGVEVFGMAFKDAADSGTGDVYYFCEDTVPNSTGQKGRLSVGGSAVVANNDLTLSADQLPTSTFGTFVVGRFDDVFLPGSLGSGTDGALCIGDAPVGIFRGPGLVQSTGATGTMSAAIDLTNVPVSGSGSAVAPGDRLVFQAWFRDSGPQGSNLSNAAQVFFR